MSSEEYKAYVIRVSEERKEFVTGDDGYVEYWPASFTGGGYNATELRILADELDKRNAKWDQQVQQYFQDQHHD